MFSSIKSATLVGVSAIVIRVEVHTSSGFPGYTVVGMPDVAMKESKERIRAAIISSGIKWPSSRITINLAPANIRKSGTGSELAILIGLLCSSGELDKNRFKESGVIGEIGLDGTLRSVPGTIARVRALKNTGVHQVFVPLENAYEASLVKDIEVFPINSLRELLECLQEARPWPDIEEPREKIVENNTFCDYSDISGQNLGCEAMMLLAAGGHHTLLMGSPGIGKTMLAERVPSILPELLDEESHEITEIKSVLEGGVTTLARNRPFRRPHHSASATSLIGGGNSYPIPGEVTRAHRGILFLDELSEFSSIALESLRQPIELGEVMISRANFHARFPAHFSLLACSNPCPCAKPRDKCICSDATRQRYIKKLSGPLIDRFDIRIELFNSPSLKRPTHSTSSMKEKILRACFAQQKRYTEMNIEPQIFRNNQLNSSLIETVAPLNDKLKSHFVDLIEKREISGRGSIAIRRVARTLADLDGEKEISDINLFKAFDLREEFE